MKWNNGASRTPQPKDIQDFFREYEVEMIKQGINYDIVEINIWKLATARNLGNVRLPVTYEPPVWCANEEDVAKVDGVDAVTPYDTDIAVRLIELMKKDGEKMKVKVKLNKNVQAIIRDAGVL